MGILRSLFRGKKNSIQLSLEGGVNSSGYILRCKSSRYISPKGESCFSIYQIKIKKELFVNKGRHFVRVCLRFN